MGRCPCACGAICPCLALERHDQERRSSNDVERNDGATGGRHKILASGRHSARLQAQLLQPRQYAPVPFGFGAQQPYARERPCVTLSIRTSLVDADSLSGRRIARTVRTIRCFRQPKSVLNTPPYYFSTVRVPSTTEELACFIASVRVFSSIRSSVPPSIKGSRTEAHRPQCVENRAAAARNVTAASARRGAPGCGPAACPRYTVVSRGFFWSRANYRVFPSTYLHYF